MLVLQYILITVTLTILVLIACIKIKYPFWNLQPVYHTYDYWRYLYVYPFMIYKYRPVKTKFCDFDRTITLPYLDCSLEQKKTLTDLIQCYYINNERIIHTMTEQDVDAYLTGSVEPSLVSFYYEQKYDEKHDKSYINPIGCITSRAKTFYYRVTNLENTYEEKPIYFLDYISVHREQDVLHANRTLLQTHEYNQRIQNKNVHISLLKKEIDLFDGVIPLTTYDTTTYYLSNHPISSLPAHFHISSIGKENISLLTDFIETLTKTNFQHQSCLFEICIIESTSYLLSLIEQGLIYIYCLKNKKEVLGFYFFKDTKTQYDEFEGNTLQCYASVMNCNTEIVFFRGFLHSLQEIRKQKPQFKMFLFENTSHNQILLKHWRTLYTPIFTNKTAYYLYNFIYPCSPIAPEKILFIN